MMSLMLLNNFFHIKSYHNVPEHPDKYIVHVEINEKHAIFEGHFPEIPVTPGVCLVQMVKESVGVILGKRLTMTKADHIKFMAIVNPLVNKELVLDVSVKPENAGCWICDAVTHFEKKIFFKLRAHFREIPVATS